MSGERFREAPAFVGSAGGRIPLWERAIHPAAHQHRDGLGDGGHIFRIDGEGGRVAAQHIARGAIRHEPEDWLPGAEVFVELAG